MYLPFFFKTIQTPRTVNLRWPAVRPGLPVFRSFLAFFTAGVLFFSSSGMTAQIKQPSQSTPSQNRETFDPLDAHPELLMVLRIPHIQEWGPKIDQWLLAIRSTWPSKGWNALTPIGQYLRNPSLDNIESPGWIEMLIFNPKVAGSPSIVLAFPVSEPSAYIRHLAGQPAIANQTVGAGISHLREQHGNTTDLFLSPVATRVMLFSTNRKTVEMASELYEREENGLIPEPQGDMELHFNPKRILKAFSAEIDQELLQLRDDIDNDMQNSFSQLAAPVNRILQSGLSELKGMTGQIIRIQAIVSLNPNEIKIECNTHYTEDDLASYFRMETAKKITLLQALPERSVNRFWSSVSAENVHLLASGLARTCSTGLEGAVNSNARQTCTSILESFLAMVPDETVAATLPAIKEDNPIQSQVRLFSIKKPELLTPFLQSLSGLLAPGNGLIDSFERSGIAVILDHRPLAWTDSRSNTPVQSVSLISRSSGSSREDGMNQKVLQFKHSFYLATVKNVLILLTSETPKEDMEEVIQSLLSPSTPKNSVTGNALMVLSDAPYSSAWILSPLSYLKTASRTSMLTGREFFQNGRPHASVNNSLQFQSFRESAWPMIITSRTELYGELKKPITKTGFTLKTETVEVLFRALLDTTINQPTPDSN